MPDDSNTGPFGRISRRAAQSLAGLYHRSADTEESRHWLVRTVWIFDQGREAPRLVTAYPGKE